MDRRPKRDPKAPKGPPLPTYREQYESIERQTGKTPPELEGLPELPECAAHVWGWYQDLTGKRTIGMAMNPITWPDVDSWCNRRKLDPKQWELDAIFGIDEAFRTVMSEETK